MNHDCNGDSHAYMQLNTEGCAQNHTGECMWYSRKNCSYQNNPGTVCCLCLWWKLNCLTYEYHKQNCLPTGSENSQMPVYILSVATGLLTLLIVLLSVMMFALCATLRKSKSSCGKIHNCLHWQYQAAVDAQPTSIKSKITYMHLLWGLAAVSAFVP